MTGSSAEAEASRPRRVNATSRRFSGSLSIASTTFEVSWPIFTWSATWDASLIVPPNFPRNSELRSKLRAELGQGRMLAIDESGFRRQIKALRSPENVLADAGGHQKSLSIPVRIVENSFRRLELILALALRVAKASPLALVRSRTCACCDCRTCLAGF
jgi:hypothetical protein